MTQSRNDRLYARLEARLEGQEAAQKRLAQRYADPDAQWSTPVGELVRRVEQALLRPGGDGPQDEDQEQDVLDAITAMGELREHLDRLELRATNHLRRRGVTWDRLADAQGLATRQSAESRHARLQRAHSSGGASRDVGEARHDRARERNLTAWADAREQRLQRVAAALVDSSAAWTTLADNPGFTAPLQTLAARLASASDPRALWEAMVALRPALVPFDGHAPAPTGPLAEQAVAARRELGELLLAASKAGAAR